MPIEIFHFTSEIHLNLYVCRKLSANLVDTNAHKLKSQLSLMISWMSIYRYYPGDSNLSATIVIIDPNHDHFVASTHHKSRFEAH